MTGSTPPLPPRRAARPPAWLLATALLVLLPPVRPPAQGNPFFRAPAPSGPSLSVTAPWLSGLISAQGRLRELLSEAVERTAAGSTGVLPLLGIAFVYGLLHALGPGHRKMALGAYFLARPARIRDGLKAGTAVALLHALSAVALVFGLYYILKLSVNAAFSSVNSVLELSSYAAIALLGLVLLILAVRGWRRAVKTDAADSDPDGRAGKSLAAIVVSSGVVPCPGAALILIFCLSQNLPGVGLLAALAMSLGMAVVTVSVSLLTVLGKRRLFAVLSRGSGTGRLLHYLLEIAGAALLLAFGLFMLSPYLVAH